MFKGINLTENDLNLAHTIGRFKFLTRVQLQTLFFSNEETAFKRLATLTKAGVISRVFFFPIATEKIHHPTAAYFYSPENHKNLQALLYHRAQASLWEDYFEELPTNPRKKFSPFFLSHETELSSFFLSLESGLPRDGFELACWERTSPISKEISKVFRVGNHTFHFNPDGFVSLTKNGRYSFFWVEYDNNTGSRARYERKLKGYELYQKRGHFQRDLSYLLKKHNISLTDSQLNRARFRVLHLTPDEKRRDDLFFVALKMESYKMHQFASLTHTPPEKILSPIWMRPFEFKPTPAELQYLQRPRMTPGIKAHFSNMLAQMPRISLRE